MRRGESKHRYDVGMIGFGRIARRHVTAITALSDRLRLVAVAEPDPTAGEEILALGAARYEDHAALLAAHQCDLVVIASPSGLHRLHTEAALSHGAYALVEKPLAMTLADAEALHEASIQARRAMQVCYQMRFYPTLMLAHRAVQEGHLGKIHAVDMKIFWTRPQRYYDEASWRGSDALDGGVLLNQTNHYLDLLGWIMGMPVAISGREATLGRDIEASDSAAFVIEWGGCLGTFMTSMLTYPKNLGASLTILGERGTIQLGGAACDVIETWELAHDFCSREERAQAERDTARVRQEGHLPLYRHVLSDFDTWRGAPPQFSRSSAPLAGPLLTEGARCASARGERILFQSLLAASGV